MALLLQLALASTPAGETNGFAVRFTSGDGKSSDTMVLPNLWLYVEQGKPATPFLPPGNFTAVFEGSILGDLRGNYFFKADELGGAVRLEINGAVVLDTGAAGALSPSVQINKGANAVKATFTSPARGDAFVRLGWMEKGTNAVPIPNPVITHGRSPELQKAEAIYLGRELFLEHRCSQCHAEKFASPVPELSMDAPVFDGVGLRRREEWLAGWVLDPKAARASAHMPKLLHGPKAKEDAAAIAAYLASLKNETGPPAVTAPPRFGFNARAVAEISKRSGSGAKAVISDANEPPVDASRERKPVFERWHCTACHQPPDKTELEPGKISLKHVAQKFPVGKLVEFLQAPERHFAWTRMPNFKLDDAEARELAAFLLRHADKPEPATGKDRTTLVTRGQELMQTIGCLNCHRASGLENRFGAPDLAKLGKQARGCLAESRDSSSPAPDFAFSAAERAALLAFIKTDFASLSRHAPVEFAAREARLLQCTACHGQIDLVPPFEVLGGKLKPEWAAGFLAGEPFKVRADKHPKGDPWVEARMPAFKTRAALLAEGMAMQQGYPPRTPAGGVIDEEAAKIGQKLFGKENGLSCTPCHAINELPALEVFESEGINVGLTGARLLKPYFFRWVRNPLAIDPQTKMPAFFDEEGRSARTEYYDGDAEKQINALYEYLRQGEKIAAPATGE